MFLLFLLNMLLAATFTLAKIASVYCAPLSFVGIRMCIAGIVLSGYAFLSQGRLLRGAAWSTLFLFGQVALFHIFFAYALEFLALPAMSSIKVSILYSLFPLIMGVFMFLGEGERLVWRQWIGIALGMIGSFLLVVPHCSLHSSLSFSCSGADLLLLGSICSAVYGWIVVRKLLRYHHRSIIEVNGIGMLGGGILCSLCAYFFEPRFIIVGIPYDEVWLHGFAMGIAMLVLLIILANIITYNVYGLLLHRYSPTVIGFSGILIPLFTSCYGILFLGERLTSTMLAAFFFFFLALGSFFCFPQK